jgi:hypothetical protein
MNLRLTFAGIIGHRVAGSSVPFQMFRGMYKTLTFLLALSPTGAETMCQLCGEQRCLAGKNPVTASDA